jgi:PPOX class probable F420-dependent enzyme
MNATIGTRTASGSGGAGHAAHAYIVALAVLAGAGMALAGVWSLLAPRSFAAAVDFPYSEHFLHDLGAFQLGIGVTLLLAVAWRDGLALALAGFLVGNTVHAVNHAVDLDIGGHDFDQWGLAALSLLVAVALAMRLRELGYVIGEVSTAATPALEPFVRQKTVLLTTFRRDGTPVGTPLSIAVDGDRAYIRSYERAGKTRRLRGNAAVEIAPCTTRGRPTGPSLHARARRLSGAEDRHAARLLERKHPFLQGIMVPFFHRLGRSRYGRTVHFELALAPRPAADGGGSAQARAETPVAGRTRR